MYVCINPLSVRVKYVKFLTVSYNSKWLEKNIEDPKELLFMWIISTNTYQIRNCNR